MSKYSTSIEVIVNSQSHHQYDLYERIEDGRHFIFDFEYLTPMMILKSHLKHNSLKSIGKIALDLKLFHYSNEVKTEVRNVNA